MGETHTRIRKGLFITCIGLVINVLLVIVKLAGGIAAKSNALIADAIHSLSDITSDVIVLLGFKFASRPVDKTHDYGHGKFETMSAFFVGAVLVFVGGGIFITGARNIVLSLRGHELHRPGLAALYIAGFSILIKEVLYRYTAAIGKKMQSQALIANAWHHRSDALSSIAAFLGIAGAIFLGKSWRILDPIAAIFVSIMIFKVAIDVSMISFKELLETSLSEETEEKIEQIITTVPGVLDVHKLRTRRIGNVIAIDVHIKVDKILTIVEAHHISQCVEINLKKSFGKETFIYIHIEPDGE